MRHRGARQSRKGRIAAFALGFLVVLVLLVMMLSSDVPETPDAGANAGGSLRSPTVPVGGPPVKRVSDIAERAERLRSMRENFLDLHSTAAKVMDEYCSTLTQHEQLMDEDCTKTWLNKLKNGKITAVERLWGFEETHFGAITVVIEDSIRAMFKPCTSKGEDTSKEVIASTLDKLLGYGQTAPVIMRYVQHDALDHLVVGEKERAVLLETQEKCMVEGGYTGPLIGWWENLIPIRTPRKYKETREDLQTWRENASENLEVTQRTSRFQSYYALIDILRHGKDEFISSHGELVALDLDRSRFKLSANPLTSIHTNYTWCYVCYMDKWVYNTLSSVGPSQPPEHRIGRLLGLALSGDPLSPDIWDDRMADALDKRLKELLDCLDGCIAQYGRENVLIDVPWTMRPIDLVRWYVFHSEYKEKRNGQTGPKNLDFLQSSQWPYWDDG